MKKWLFGAAALVSIGLICAAVYTRTPAAPHYSPDTAREAAKGYDVRIIRDGYGVPHVFGKRDADTAFGFGYAHAEDDWTTIQDTVIAARGKSAEYKGKEVAPQDYLYDLFKVGKSVAQNYDADVSADAKAVAKAYAAAMNLYGVNNPDEVLPNILPITEQDVLAGFAWATPFFLSLGWISDGVVYG